MEVDSKRPLFKQVINTLSFLTLLIRTNLKSAVALRGAFLLQSAFMILNNLIIFAVWWIFFQSVEEIRGWKLQDMAALYGVVATSFGLAVVFGGGMRQLPSTISEGKLDSFLTQPKNVLLHTVGSYSQSSGWGDILSGGFLFLMSGYTTPENVLLMFLIVASSTAIILSTGVLMSCAAFWLGPVESLVKQFFEFVLLFSIYPPNVYSGLVKTILFTLIPAGFIAFLPVEILRDFSWFKLFATIGAAVLYSFLAGFVFQLGLRSYQSGNKVGAF